MFCLNNKETVTDQMFGSSQLSITHQSGLSFQSVLISIKLFARTQTHWQIRTHTHCAKWCVFTACSFPLSNCWLREQGQERERKEGDRKREGGLAGSVFVLKRNSPLACNWRQRKRERRGRERQQKLLGWGRVG